MISGLTLFLTPTGWLLLSLQEIAAVSYGVSVCFWNIISTQLPSLKQTFTPVTRLIWSLSSQLSETWICLVCPVWWIWIVTRYFPGMNSFAVACTMSLQFFFFCIYYCCCGWAWCCLYIDANSALLGRAVNKEWVILRWLLVNQSPNE